MDGNPCEKYKHPFIIWNDYKRRETKVSYESLFAEEYKIFTPSPISEVRAMKPNLSFEKNSFPGEPKFAAPQRSPISARLCSQYKGVIIASVEYHTDKESQAFAMIDEKIGKNTRRVLIESGQWANSKKSSRKVFRFPCNGCRSLTPLIENI